MIRLKRIVRLDLRWMAAAIIWTLAILGTIHLHAAENADLTGTWRWIYRFPGGGGQGLGFTAKFTQKGSKLDGELLRRSGGPPTPFTNGIVSADSVEFIFMPGTGGNRFTTWYRGKIQGNEIHGTIESNRQGKLESQEWTATKVDPTTAASGSWAWSYSTQDGQSVNATLKLVHKDKSLSGTYTGRDGRDFQVSNGTLIDGVMTFDVIRERDGTTFTNHYSGKFSDEFIKGKMEIDRGVERRVLDWDARRTGL